MIMNKKEILLNILKRIKIQKEAKMRPTSIKNKNQQDSLRIK